MCLGPIDLTEPLTRFIYSKKYYNKQKMVVFNGAFWPPKNRRLSVFRISRLLENQIWKIGKRISKKRRESLKARADIKANSVIETGLSINSGLGLSRHVNVIDWPEDRSHILLKATELAQSATLKLLA
jgi:hypothetical protein